MLVIAKKIIAAFDQLLLTAGALCLLGIVISVSTGVISRRFFNNPLTWPEELSTFLFIILSFFGAACCAFRRREVVVDYFLHKIPKGYVKLITIVCKTMVMVFLVLVVYGGVLLQSRLIAQGHTSVALNIPRNFYFIPILIASFQIFLIYLLDTVGLLTGKVQVDDLIPDTRKEKFPVSEVLMEDVPEAFQDKAAEPETKEGEK